MYPSKTIRWYLTRAQSKRASIGNDSRIDSPGNPYRGGGCERLVSALSRELKRSIGYEDRVAKRPCASTDGAYLDGYHGLDSDGLYYVTSSELSAIVGIND